MEHSDLASERPTLQPDPPETDPDSGTVFDEFVSKLWKRMERGEHVYEGRSWSKDPDKLLDEIEQELLDVCGWGVLLWSRIRAMRDAVKEARR